MGVGPPLGANVPTFSIFSLPVSVVPTNCTSFRDFAQQRVTTDVQTQRIPRSFQMPSRFLVQRSSKCFQYGEHQVSYDILKTFSVFVVGLIWSAPQSRVALRSVAACGGHVETRSTCLTGMLRRLHFAPNFHSPRQYWRVCEVRQELIHAPNAMRPYSRCYLVEPLTSPLNCVFSPCVWPIIHEMLVQEQYAVISQRSSLFVPWCIGQRCIQAVVDERKVPYRMGRSFTMGNGITIAAHRWGPLSAPLLRHDVFDVQIPRNLTRFCHLGAKLTFDGREQHSQPPPCQPLIKRGGNEPVLQFHVVPLSANITETPATFGISVGRWR